MNGVLGVIHCSPNRYAAYGSFKGAFSVVTDIASKRLSLSLPPLRHYSSSAKPEVFEVVCASSGSITVELYNRHLLARPNTPLFVYLPPRSASYPITAATATASATATAAATPPGFLLRNHPLLIINYRWCYTVPLGRPFSLARSSVSSSLPRPNHAFPTSLHDVFSAWTFLLTDLLPSVDSSASRPNNNPIPRPLIIHASSFAGCLGTSLALTESKVAMSKTHRLAGLIVRDGIFDWTSVLASSYQVTAASDFNAAGLSSDPDVRELAEHNGIAKATAALETLFARPASCFDSFVSPILFFRTAAWEIPPVFASQVPLLVDTATTSSPSSGLLSPPPFQLSKLRSSYLKFPPTGSDLRIPRSLFLVSSSSSSSSKSSPSSPQTKPHPSSNTKGTKSKTRSKSSKESEEERQAREMAKMMLRSVTLEEESQDGHLTGTDEVSGTLKGAKKTRVRVAQLGREDQVGDATRQEEEEEALVKEWLAEEYEEMR